MNAALARRYTRSDISASSLSKKFGKVITPQSSAIAVGVAVMMIRSEARGLIETRRAYTTNPTNTIACSPPKDRSFLGNDGKNAHA